MRPEIARRSVTDSDGPFLLRLYASTRVDITSSRLGEEQKSSLIQMQFAAQSLHYRTNYPNAEHSIVLVASSPIGRLYLDCGVDEYRIVDLSLLPEYRGAGIGTRLLEEILVRARTVGAPVRLHVEHFNPARRLYERFGFVPVSETASHCLMEWSPSRGLILPDISPES